ESSGQGIEVRIVAQSQEACALLAHGQQQLREELERTGLALQSFSTSVSADAGHSEPSMGQRQQQERAPSFSTPVSSGGSSTVSLPRSAASGSRRLDRRA